VCSLERHINALSLYLHLFLNACMTVSVSMHLYVQICVYVVESYTREAGVRTLERRIGALCRAVAVKVAEHLHKLNVSKPLTTQSAVNNEDSAKAGKQEVDASETVDIMNVSNLTIPPKLPIVIDVAAVEDILGVHIRQCLAIEYFFLYIQHTVGIGTR